MRPRPFLSLRGAAAAAFALAALALAGHAGAQGARAPAPAASAAPAAPQQSTPKTAAIPKALEEKFPGAEIRHVPKTNFPASTREAQQTLL